MSVAEPKSVNMQKKRRRSAGGMTPLVIPQPTERLQNSASQRKRKVLIQPNVSLLLLNNNIFSSY